jgi:hypothetical protein
MTVDLSTYRIAPGEKPASASKQNNLLGALEAALNNFPPAQIVGYPLDYTKYLDGSGAWSAPPVPTIPPGIPTSYVKTTTTDVVSTAAKTDLLGGAFTIPANQMGASGCAKLVAGGDALINVASSPIILEMKLGATTLWQSIASDQLTASAVRHAWHLTAVIQAMGSTSAQMASGLFVLGPAVAPTVGVGSVNDPYTTSRALLTPFLAAASAVAMTSAQALTFSVTHASANAALSMRCLYARLEVVT